MSHEQDQCEQAPAYQISVKLSPQAIEEMRCMFLHGPTWDGNHPSKSGRDELFDLKLATRIEGWSWLTADGMRLALKNGLDRDKERWERDRHRKLSQLSEIESMFSGGQAMTQTSQGNVMGLAGNAGRPTIEGLEKLLEKERTP